MTDITKLETNVHMLSFISFFLRCNLTRSFSSFPVYVDDNNQNVVLGKGTTEEIFICIQQLNACNSFQDLV